MISLSENLSVVVCGGAQRPALNKVKQYTNKDKVVFIGVDRGCLELIKAGYRLDYAVGDFDSVNQTERAYIKQHSDNFVSYPSDKDDTDMELALQLAKDKFGQAAFYLFGAIGESPGRLDHMLANIWLVHQPRFASIIERLHFIENNHYLSYYKAGKHQIKPGSVPDYLSVISLTPIEELTIKNAVYNLRSTDIPYPRALISNEFIHADQPVEISFTRGLLLVMKINEIDSK